MLMVEQSSLSEVVCRGCLKAICIDCFDIMAGDCSTELAENSLSFMLSVEWVDGDLVGKVGNSLIVNSVVG